MAEIIISFHHQGHAPFVKKICKKGRNLFDCSMAEKKQNICKKNQKDKNIIVV